MRIHWTPQLRGKGPRGLHMVIWKCASGTWRWEVVNSDCEILASGERDEVLAARMDCVEKVKELVKAELRYGYQALQEDF